MDATAKRLVTADKLYAMGTDEHAELSGGVLVAREPAGFYHGRVGGEILYSIRSYLARHPIGVVVTAETGFVLARNPDTVRAPDCAVVLRQRLAEDAGPTTFFDGAPDLAVEVRSPSETWKDLTEKVREYLAAGTRLAWIADPESRTVHVHGPGGSSVLSGSDVLDGGDVLPGFRVAVADLFA